MPYNVGWKKMGAVLCAAAAVEGLLAWVVGIDRPLRGDELHFVETIVHFGTSPLSLDLIAHYNEMSGPVPFVLYGAWGRMFGFEPHVLRLFSIAVALATYAFLYWFLQSESGDARLALGGTAFVALHPYMLYLSLFIYTDMLAILCLIVALAAVRRERPLWLAAALAGAVLNRQYLVFVTLGAGAYTLARYLKRRERRDLVQMLAVAASTLPLAGLCLLWKGLCPDGGLKHVYLEQHTSYHVSSLVLYVSLAAIYLSPVLALRWRTFIPRKSAALAALALSGLYWVFPVSPSPSAVEAGTFQVGMLHQTLHRLSGNELVAQLVFFAGFAGGLAIVGGLVVDSVARWRSGRIDYQFFLDLTVIMFFAVMPFSYLHWEKYFMPLVPILVLRILFVPFRDVAIAVTDRNDGTHESSDLAVSPVPAQPLRTNRAA
jgi:hypothetical protein